MIKVVNRNMLIFDESSFIIMKTPNRESLPLQIIHSSSSDVNEFS